MSKTGWIKTAAVLVIICIALFTGCASTRGDFRAVGESDCLTDDFSGDLYAWQADSSEQYKLIQKEDESHISFLESGGVSLKDSLVSDFRMEFDIRLDGPIENDIPFAMINFRNYFQKRYCLIIEPTMATINAARQKHSKLTTLDAVESKHRLRRWYKYEIAAVGNKIKVFKDDVLIFDIIDEGSEIDKGNIWFEVHSEYSVAHFKVCRLTDFVLIDEEEEAADDETAIPVSEEKITVALNNFENRGVPSYEASLLTDLYSHSLLETGVFRVIERKELDKILSEQELQLSDITSENTVKIGEILNAPYLCTGSIGKMGTTYLINVKLIRIETGETLVNEKKELSDPDTISAGIEELSRRLALKITAE
jgi:TolB-like protein